MAKATVTLAVLLLLFAVAQARFSLDLEKTAVNEEPEAVFGEFKSKSKPKFLLLPTEKPETEPEIETELDTEGIIGFDLEGDEAKLTESETSGGESATTQSSTEPEDSNSGSDADSDSVTVISFRPMNQHFRRFPSSFRRGHRCHHHHQREGGPMFRTEEGLRRERGYGNDMILSEEGMKLETVHRDSQRLVPGRLMSFRNGDGMRMHHHRFGRHEEMHREREHEQEYSDNNQEDHEHHEHDHHEHGHHEHEHHHHHHEHENVFMRKIRKFLTNF